MFPIDVFRDTVCKLVEILHQHQISFHLTGGITSIAFGEPRLTQDVDIVIDNARVFENAAEAVADLNKVYAATARLRDMIKPMMTPREGALDMQAAIAGGATVGVLFGSERAGLDNDDVTLADTLLN
ncbi:MAG: hypothetical protein ABGZ24_28070, partial [Fuerstiella sp.]